MTPESGRVANETQLQVTIDWNRMQDAAVDGSIAINGPGDAPVSVRIQPLRSPGNTAQSLNGSVESDRCVSIEAEHFTASHDAGARWERIPSHGRTLSSMTIFPVTAASAAPPADSACLEYRMYLFDAGDVDVGAIVAPTLAFVPSRGLRYGVSFDDQAPQVVVILADKSLNAWDTSVKDAVRSSHSHHLLATPGYHILKFWQVDAGVVLQKLVVDLGGVQPSYLGPPESFRHVAP